MWNSYRYSPDQVQLRLYVGLFSGRKAGEHEQRVRAWAAEQRVGGGPIEVIGVQEVVRVVREAAGGTGTATALLYRDSAVLLTLKALQAAGEVVV